MAKKVVSKKKSTGTKKYTKKNARKDEVIGSETIFEKIRRKTPWIFGTKLRKPKIVFPKFKRINVSLPLPAKTLSLIGVYVILFILQTGVVYLIYRDPPALGANSDGSAMFLYPSIHDSFIIEGIVASILIFLCSMGYILLYHASKYLYDRKIALRIVILGIILTLVSFVFLQYMINAKIGINIYDLTPG